MIIEIVGILATVLILVSMLVKTTTLKGSIFMRAVNAIGSMVFVVYGILLPAISTAILNGALIIVNLYYLVMLIIEARQKKNIKESENLIDNKTEA